MCLCGSPLSSRNDGPKTCPSPGLGPLLRDPAPSPLPHPRFPCRGTNLPARIQLFWNCAYLSLRFPALASTSCHAISGPPLSALGRPWHERSQSGSSEDAKADIFARGLFLPLHRVAPGCFCAANFTQGLHTELDQGAVNMAMSALRCNLIASLPEILCRVRPRYIVVLH
jgi:hypothetical protein